jgi:quercetin dioxygenase-like cupin family protein
MNIIDIHGLSDDAIVGREHGASRILIWCTAAPVGHVVGLHHHNGEEFCRVLSGKVRYRVGDDVRACGPGAIIIVSPGVTHGYVVLEDAELEFYGEIGSGVFVTEPGAEGTPTEREIFVRDVPWSRVPDSGSDYISREEQLRRFRKDYQESPFA